MQNAKTKKIALLGLLLALMIVFERFLGIRTPILAITFAFVPLSIIAILYGPFFAAAAATIADLLGMLLFPSGQYFWGFTLSAALTGLVYGIFLYKKPKKLWRIIAACLIISLGISLGLNSFWLYLTTGKAFLVLLQPRILQNLIVVPLRILVIYFLVYRLLNLVKAEEYVPK